MPNWTEHTRHVVAPKVELDCFIRTGYTRKSREQFDNLLHFDRLCPLKRGDPKSTYTHDNGVVLIHFRTRTQASFSMITSWDYPAEFYARLAKRWPTLSFACSVNGEMGDFGGVIVSIGGKTGGRLWRDDSLDRRKDGESRPRLRRRLRSSPARATDCARAPRLGSLPDSRP